MKKYIAIILFKSMSSLLLAFLPLFLMKVYGSEFSGEFTYYFSLVVVFSVFVKLGLDVDFIKRNAKFKLRLSRFNSAYNTSLLVFFILNALLVYIVLNFIFDYFVSLSLALCILAFSVISLCSTYFYNNYRLFLGLFFGSAGWVFIFILLSSFFSHNVYYILCISLLFPFFLFLYLFKDRFLLLRVRKFVILFYFIAPSYFVIAFVPISFNYLSNLFVGEMYGYDSLANYVAITRYGFVISFVFISINQFVSHRIRTAFMSHGYVDEFPNYVIKVNKYLFWISSLVFLIMFSTLGLYIDYLSLSDWLYYPALIFMTGSYFNSATGCVASVLTMTGYQTFVSRVLLLSFAFFSFLCVLLIDFNLLGVTVSYLLAMIFQNVILLLKVKKEHNFNPVSVF